MIFILAIAIGFVCGALANRWAVTRRLGEAARICAAIAGFIVGYLAVYIVNAHI